MVKWYSLVIAQSLVRELITWGPFSRSPVLQVALDMQHPNLLQYLWFTSALLVVVKPQSLPVPLLTILVLFVQNKFESIR